MAYQKWVETLGTALVAGTALSTNNTATSILPSEAKVLLPPNYFYIGKMLRIRAGGQLTGVAAASTTQAFDIRFGSVTVFTSTWATPATAVTNAAWKLDLDLVCRAIGGGTSANMIGIGTFLYMVGTASGNGQSETLPNTAPAVGTGFDSTASQLVDLRATILTASVSSLQLMTYSLESMN